MNKNNFTTLDEFLDEQYGLKGTEKRDEYDSGYKDFKLGVLLHQARVKKGMTQADLAKFFY